MQNFSEMIKEDNAKLYNVRDELKPLNVKAIYDWRNNGQTLPFAVGLLNITGDLNMGMILRSAEILGAERALIWGRRKMDNRSLVGADNYLPISWLGGDEIFAPQLDKDLQAHNYVPVFAEHAGASLEQVPMLQLVKKPCFIFGREATGIPPEVLQYFAGKSLTVSIPQYGALRSFNVSAAAAMVMWEYVRGYKNAQIKTASSNSPSTE